VTTTRVLITGITGFVGSHLADYLTGLDDIELWGTKRRRSDRSNLHVDANLIDCELTDPTSVYTAVHLANPDLVFHLAAQSFVPESHTAPQHTLAVNVLGTLNLLVALTNRCPEARLLVAGSSEEYGHIFPTDCPIKEYQPLRPLSPYGVSKVAMELLAQQFHASYGLHVVTTRAFNHTGPRRGEQFVTSSFAKQVAEIEAGAREPIVSVGNLQARRDWTDVRDMVRAYWLAINHCRPAEPYNICTGKAHRINDILYILQREVTVTFTTQADPARIRPSDIPLLRGSREKFTKATGWKPTIPFDQTVKDLLDYWRAKVN
jgi:GDP-4-dehydro-6-deoxy-D-mannose reductase